MAEVTEAERERRAARASARRERRSAAGDTPPDMFPPPDSPKISSPGRPATKGLQKRLEEFFGAMALPFALAGDQHCATIVAQGAEPLAEAWANLANENAGVKRVLERLLQGGAWGGVIVSTLSIALPIAAHHGLALPLPGMPQSPQPEQEPEVIVTPPPPPEQNGNGSPNHPLGPIQPTEAF